MPVITQHELDKYLGQSIGQICPNGVTNSQHGHGAHFVAHVLKFQLGVTCQVVGKGSGPGASLRVQDLFSRCPSVGAWSLRPVELTTSLIFMAGVSQVHLATKQMNTAPQKHVGIYSGGLVWHYSHGQAKVIKQTPAQFSASQPAPHNALFFGALP